MMTRPRRQLLFGAVLGLVVLPVLWLLFVQPSGMRYGPIPGGRQTVSEGGSNFYTHGVTQWLIVEVQGEWTVPRAPIERRYHFNGSRLVESLATVALLVAAGLWLHWLLVRRFRTRGRCDRCGYDLSGSRSPYCPECGEGRGDGAAPPRGHEKENRGSG